MAAYVILDMTITDRALQAEYRARFPEVLAAYGGRVKMGGDIAESIEGEAVPRRLTVLEFGTYEQGMDWHRLWDATPRQAEVRALRDRMGTVNRVYVVGGDEIG